jgi:hypothetical protein
MVMARKTGSMVAKSDDTGPLDNLDPEVHDNVWLFLRESPTLERQALIFNALE